MIKILNLYCGIGGNRRLWGGDIEVTAVEIDPLIAEAYKKFFPEDKVIIGDAHQYLLEHYKEFNFIWSSPPCPSHSQFRFNCGVLAWNYPPVYPDMNLYEEIIFLKHYFKGKWVVENVVSFYEPLIKPYLIQRHFFWSNFPISNKKNIMADDIRNRGKKTQKEKELQYGFNLDGIKGLDKIKVLNNCVNSELGLHVFESAFCNKQLTLIQTQVNMGVKKDE